MIPTLQKTTHETDAIGSVADQAEGERLFREAEGCFRCARAPGLKKEVALCLEAAGTNFWARAVDIEIANERAKYKG